MPKEQGVLRRLLVKVFPQLIEDWISVAGARFRKGTRAVSDYNRDHAKVGDKIDAVPEMLWKAAEGATSAQHAKAEADYAKAENDRMEAELRRRTLEAKTRHECADADKADAEAGIARTREIQARLELFKQLTDAGVSVVLDAQLALSVIPTPQSRAPLTGILNSEELDIVRQRLFDLTLSELDYVSWDEVPVVLEKWYVSVGDRVAVDTMLANFVVAASPVYTLSIRSPLNGIVFQVLVNSGTRMDRSRIIATLLPDA